MQKDFDSWNRQKVVTHNRVVRPPFKQGEVWWCSLGVNVGDEQDGKGAFFSRPVLIYRKFNPNIFLGLPLSTVMKRHPFYHALHFKGIDQCVILSQIKLMDGKRLENKMGDLPSHEHDRVRAAMAKLLL